MNTSYFAKYKGDKGVSIAIITPRWASKHRRYPPLMPTRELVNAYKKGLITPQEYETQYMAILTERGITPRQVLADLGDDAVLLCYEKKGLFCHRHIVAKWLRKDGIMGTEL